MSKKSLDEFTLVDFVSSLVQTHHEQFLLERPYVEKNEFSEALYVEYKKSNKKIKNPLENFIYLYLLEYEKITGKNFFNVFYIYEHDMYTVIFYQKLYQIANNPKNNDYMDKRSVMVKNVISSDIFNNINAKLCSCIYITNCGVKEYDCSVFSKAQLELLGRKLPFYKQKLFINLHFDKTDKKIWNELNIKKIFQKNIDLNNFKNFNFFRYEVNTNFIEKNEDKNYFIETINYNYMTSKQILSELKSMEFKEKIKNAAYCEYSLYYSIEIFSNFLFLKNLSINFSKKNNLKKILKNIFGYL